MSRPHSEEQSPSTRPSADEDEPLTDAGAGQAGAGQAGAGQIGAGQSGVHQSEPEEVETDTSPPEAFDTDYYTTATSSDGQKKKKQHFPETSYGLFKEELGRGEEGRKVINQHVMSVYYRPLQYYFRGLKGHHRIGEPEDVINGYFADRLDRPDFFAKWELKRREKGILLRRWLMNGLHFYLKELIRKKNHGESGLPEEELISNDEMPDSTSEYDRQFAHSLVDEALKLVKKYCEEKELNPHWEIFIRHHVKEEAYKDFCQEYDVDPVRASVMARTVRDWFRRKVEQLLIEDGVSPRNVQNEIRDLLSRLREAGLH